MGNSALPFLSSIRATRSEQPCGLFQHLKLVCVPFYMFFYFVEADSDVEEEHGQSCQACSCACWCAAGAGW